MSRSPDFILKALNKQTDHRTGKIGAAWKNEDGSISLSLDITMMPDPACVLTLFPNDQKRPAGRSKQPRPKVRMADLPVSRIHRCEG